MRRVSLFITFCIIIAVMLSCSKSVIYPSALRPGDKIAILAPAGPIDSAIVIEAADTLRALGYEPVIYPTSFTKHGHFSAPHSERAADLAKAFTDSEIRAILCARGGYGAALILDSVAALPLRKDPKWVIGFSDISALHALMASNNIASIHASMAKQLALGADDPDNAALIDILQGKMPSYVFPADPRNHLGTAQGRLLGGNLAVIQALINTPYDIIRPGTILFIEDVAEPIYKVERIIYQLRMAGIIDRLNGLVIGQFTEYNPDDNHQSMEDMLADALADYPELPVAFNAPFGHVDHNIPLVESANATLNVSPNSVTLTLAK